jgi:DNA-binding protein HU-beta
MNRSELVTQIATNSGLSKKDSDRALTATVDAISEALKAGDKVQLVGFGTFEVRERAQRQGINPKTKQPITIAASKSPQFKPGKTLKDLVS